MQNPNHHIVVKHKTKQKTSECHFQTSAVAQEPAQAGNLQEGRARQRVRSLTWVLWGLDRTGWSDERPWVTCTLPEHQPFSGTATLKPCAARWKARLPWRNHGTR